jgi:hypothetical protein
MAQCTRCGKATFADLCARCYALSVGLLTDHQSGERKMDYLEALAKWVELKANLAVLQANEKALREQLFAGTFPSPVEGTNNYVLPDGRTVKGTYKINRTLDVDILKSRVDAGLVPAEAAASIVKWKAELKIADYKKLPAEIRSAIDVAVEAKPGLPTLEIVAAKEVAAQWR